jgi:dephospho-CoA kinase
VLKVGLTGNVASGKSSVARVWRGLGATVIDADLLAREAVAPGTPGLRRIVEAWGEAVLDADGALDRAAMREIVFRDETARQRLEAIVHPEVARLRDAAVAAAARAGESIVVSDVPLLFEAGLAGRFDLVVLVDAPEPIRLERMIRDRGMAEATARRIIAAQMPAERKRERADRVIDNSGSMESLESAARAAWEWVREVAAQRETGSDG